MSSLMYNPKLLNKHLISVGLNTVYTIQTQNTFETMSGFVEREKVGTKLSSNTYGIVIGAGVKKVRVDYCSTSQSTDINLRSFSYLLHNESQTTQESHWYSGTGQQVSTGRSGVLLEVEEGDTIGVRVYGGKNNTFVAGNSSSKYWGTTITVEVIE